MTEITYNGKEVVKMEVRTCGEDGDQVWFRYTFKDGKFVDTVVFKGEI
jgi:hypothetical protein